MIPDAPRDREAKEPCKMSTRSLSLKMIVFMALVAVAYTGLASCGGGSRPVPARGGGEMTIMPPTDNRTPDHSNTPAGATAIELSESFQGRIDSADDVDYFRLRVDSPGTLTIRTTGNGDPDIAVFDGAGDEVPGVSGSWIGRITQEILDRGSDLLVRFSGGNAGGEYTGSATLDQTPQTSPDLVVGSPTVSDSSPETGGAFTLSATVSNQGDGESAATTLRYFRSTDATITTSDTEVGTDAVAGLAPSGSDRQSVDAAAPSEPGTYYYGACVESVAGESDTANNCSTSVQVTVQEPEHPDLMVVSPSVSDNRPAPGASFTLSATVPNDGNGESAATTLRYFRSADATITMSDTSVGTDAVSGLAASVSDSRTVDMAAPSAPGTYYYGACVDAVAGESNTANNCSTAVQIKVLLTARQIQRFPDLVVGTPTASPGRPAAGTDFTLSATVSNTGGAASPSTTLRYYRSLDATITRSDTPVGTDVVPALAAAGRSNESISVTAPSNPGIYYYGACVDTVNGESETTNNCSLPVTVTSRGSDLEVGTPTVSDTSPEPGASFTLSATVSNTGSAASLPTTLRYYRSRDATITRSDTPVGTDAVPALGATVTGSESISVTAPSNPGIYYYGACVDAVNGESETTNNCSLPVTVTVPSSSPRWDLVVGANTEPRTVAAGAVFILVVVVGNNGDVASPYTALRYYHSGVRSYSSSATTWVGTDSVPALPANEGIVRLKRQIAPRSPGDHYYYACAKTVPNETSRRNNCSPFVTVTVLEGSDLVVGSPTVSEGSPAAGAAFTLSATVSNTGEAASPSTTLRYYRVRSDTPVGLSVGTDAVPELLIDGTSDQSVSLTAPTSPGIYYYYACVNAVTGEMDTTNNCTSFVWIRVLPTQQSSVTHPDLVVSPPTVSDNSPVSTGRFTLSAMVSNTGDRFSPATTLRYYRSTDAAITRSDTEEGRAAIPGLNAGKTNSRSIALAAPASPGIWYYGACVDEVTSESDTTNNCSLSVMVTVQPLPKPDLAVSSPTVSDSSPVSTRRFTVSATVSNTGDSIFGGHDAAVLPLDGRGDHAVGHGGGHGCDPRS